MDTTATVEEKGSCRKLLRIEVSASDVSRELENVYTEFSKKARVPGFRPGMVSREVLELRFSREVERKVLERIIPKAIDESVRQKELKVVSDPSLNIEKLHVRKGEPVRFEVVVDLEPEFRLSSYRRIKVKRKEVALDDEDVERELESLRERTAQFAAVEGRSIQMGDFAIIDLEETLAGGKTHSRKNLLVEMDNEKFIPGFCGSLAGMNHGEEREFTIDIPVDHHTREIAGKQVYFKVKVHEIKEKVLPEVGDDFARELGDFKDLDDLKEEIRKSIRERKELDARRDMEEQVIDELVDKNKFDLPQSLVEYHSRRMFDSSRDRLRNLGIEVEKESKREEDLRSRSQDEAVRKIKVMYILKKIAENESITVGDDELEERIEKIAGSAKRSKAQVRAHLEEEGRLDELRERMKEERVISFLLDEAGIK